MSGTLFYSSPKQGITIDCLQLSGQAIAAPSIGNPTIRKVIIKNAQPKPLVVQ